MAKPGGAAQHDRQRFTIPVADRIEVAEIRAVRRPHPQVRGYDGGGGIQRVDRPEREPVP